MEALELVSGKNTGMWDTAAKKEHALEDMRRENETLRTSEAEAQEHAEELEAQLLVAVTSTDSNVAVRKAAAVEIPLVEKWRCEAAQGNAAVHASSCASRRHF